MISKLKLVSSGASSSTFMGIFLYNNQPAGVSQSYQRMSGLEITGFQSGIKVYGGDGGAEAGMTGWTSNQVVSVAVAVADADATHARSGSRLFKLAPVAAGGNALMYQAVQRLGAGSYQASAWFSGTGGRLQQRMGHLRPVVEAPCRKLEPARQHARSPAKRAEL